MPVCTSVTEAVLIALGEFAPARRSAGVGGAGGPFITGLRSDGRRFVQYELLGAAYGGRVDRDGVSGISVLLSNSRTAPIEVIENEYPTRVRRFALIPDSGGPGRFRGGLAVRREYEILAEEAQLNLRGARHRWPAFGRDGGSPGRLGALIVGPGGSAERALPSRFSGYRLRHGDVVRIDKSGAGGYGDPRRRDPARVIADVLDGYVSPEAAVATYGLDAAQLADAIARWEEAVPA
jgi:N-methylhydantoinase B